uniref:Sushi domain-containing protein n=1 Tax=Lates calcarifer TaxID=8187 RepID=A0A4W6FMN3_LATCA
MCARYLEFILLLWFPGVLHAQSTAQSCRAPGLAHGYFLPALETYPHETKLTYACDNGLKPVVEGWWATSTCQNGKWVHNPQCIDEKACFPPTIPNAKYTENSNGWYEEGDTIRTICDEGYEHKDWSATARCTNGTWSSLPICEKSISTCGEPPKIPHAVIIHQRYQEVFAVDSEVQYECEDGYMMEGGHTKQFIYCISGTWTEAPTCSQGTRPDTGHGGSTLGGKDGGHTTSTGGGTWSTGGGSRPGTGEGTGGGHTTSSGGGTRPVEGGSSTSSRPNERVVQTQIIPKDECGAPPTIPNGDVVGNYQMFLKYRCNSFYTLMGPERVHCYADGTWSKLPTCKAAYCSVDTSQYHQLVPAGVKYIKYGEKVRLECVRQDHWWTDHFSVVQCFYGKAWLSDCCSWLEIKTNLC